MTKNTIIANDYRILNNYNKVVTHNLRFHLDEIVAICLIIIMRQSPIEIFRVTRTKEFNIEKDMILVDIGKKYDGISLFDHHQENPIMRDVRYSKEINTAFSSAGLIWNTFGQFYCIDRMKDEKKGMEVFRKIDRDFIFPIDCHDSGTFDNNGNIVNLKKDVMFQPFGLEKIAAFFNSDTLDEADQDSAFEDICSIVFRIIKRYFEFTFKNSIAKEKLEEIFSNYNGKDEYILIDKGVNGFWRAALQKNDEVWKKIQEKCKVIVFQTENDGYYVSSIPYKKNGKVSRYIFKRKSKNYNFVSKDGSQIVINGLDKLKDILKNDIKFRFEFSL